MPRKTLDIKFPAAGVVRRLGFRAATGRRGTSYPAPWATNVRLEDSLTNRLRGGSWGGAEEARAQAEIDDRTSSSPTGNYLLTLEDYDQEQNDPWQPPGGGFTWNTACWAAGLDYTGIGSYDRSYWHLVALVSPRHVIGHAHSGTMQTGDTIYFIKSDGSVYEAEVEDVSGTVGNDHQIGYLTADVDAGVNYYSVLSADSLPLSAGLPSIFFDLERKAKIGRMGTPGASTTAVVSYTAAGSYPDRAAYWEINELGDSGSPHFLLIAGELVFLGPTWLGTSHSTTSTAAQIAAVNTAMSNLDTGETGYQLQTRSLLASRPSEIRYRNRLLTFSGNAITATRMGDDTDTALSADVSDTLRPALFQLSYAGATGGTVVALIPHKDSFLLGFTADETWVQQGDPLTGQRWRVSDEVGIIGADAWCVAHDTVYFLSSRGLYSVGADGKGLLAISEDKIPKDLTGVTDASCALTYYHADRGVYIELSSGVSWFYDTARDQFWPYDTSSADSHVLIGPFRLGQANAFGRVLNLHGVMATGSADVNWRLVTGDTAEAAAANGKAAIVAHLASASYASYVASSGTWSAGRANMAYPRIRAVWCCLWLQSAGDWAFEAASLTAKLSGKWR